MPEQPHEYLANTRDRNCKLCLRDKDHSIHKEAQEMPLPGATKENMLEIQNRLDQCDRLKAINADLLAALEETMEWISNWSPRFTDDDEWQETQDKIDAAIAKAKE